MKLESALTGSTPLQSDNNRFITSANHRSNSKQQSINNELVNEETADKDKVKFAISELNEIAKPLRTNLQFKLHDKLDAYYVEVVNPLTDEIIKEIPPKQMLDRYAAMAEFMGLLVDEKI